MDDLVVQSHRGLYRVRFTPPFAGLEAGLAPEEHLLIDARVAELHAGVLGAALRGPSVLRIQADEASKSFDRIPVYVTALLNAGVRRDHTLVVVGGGVIQDIGCFIAAVLLRGLAWRYYPTTLLAQADSCIGSKSSINVGPYKNLAGTYTPPTEVVVAPDVLRTLPEVDVRSGIGEMIKVHIIAGWDDIRTLAADYDAVRARAPVLARYIRRSLEIKRERVEADEFDRGERLVLNYGHSFGHAIESATDYAVPHGIAVTLGMDMANFVSWRLGLLAREAYEELHAMLARNAAGFADVPVPPEPFLAALRRDKKRTGASLALILLRGPGAVFVDRRPDDETFRTLCAEYLDRRMDAA